MYSTYVLPSNQTMMAAVAKLGRLLGDILVRKRSDLALRAAHSELARVSQFSAMGVMTASIGHEIRQPLAAIVTGAHAGLRWISRSPPNVDEAKQTLKNIVQEGQRASDILDTIRAMFKRDSKETVPIDINSLIADVLELVQSEVRKQKVSIETKLADRLPEVSGNRIQLQQVVLNLTMNAIEAMSAMNGRERILRLKTAVHRPDGVLVTVEDSGPGIDAKDVERIFDALFTTKSKGMGMGLSICRSIIEAYHGRLWVTPGKETWIGLSFRVAGHGCRSCIESLRVLLRRVVSGYRESIAQAEGARGHELLQYLSIVAARTAWRTACPACLSKMPMLAGGSLGPPRPLFRLRPLPTLNRAPENSHLIQQHARLLGLSGGRFWLDFRQWSGARYPALLAGRASAQPGCCSQSRSRSHIFLLRDWPLRC